jgi:MFS family permease
MVSFVRSLITPIFSLFVIILGNNFLLTVVPLRMKLDGYSTEVVGYLTAAYFAGLMIGALLINRLLEGVGHIRAFAAFAAFFTVLSMLQGVFVHPAFWLVLRFFSGICMAGIFVTIESWLLVKSSVHMRGKALSIYMITTFAGQSLGQLFLDISDPSTIYPFCLGVILASVAIVPLALTKTRAPIIEEPSILNPLKLFKTSPLGTIGAFLSGCILGSVYGLLPLYTFNLDFTHSQIAAVMSITILGGLILQYPVGIISDRLDRRKVLFSLSLFTGICSLLMGLFPTQSFELFLVLAFIFGGFSFATYPVSVSHACDLIDSKDLVAATGGMLLFYGTGAIVGPILISYPMNYFGNSGFFHFITFISLVLTLFTLMRVIKKTPTAKEDKLPYSNMPRTTPMASELDPRAETSEEESNP